MRLTHPSLQREDIPWGTRAAGGRPFGATLLTGRALPPRWGSCVGAPAVSGEVLTSSVVPADGGNAST